MNESEGIDFSHQSSVWSKKKQPFSLLPNYFQSSLCAVALALFASFRIIVVSITFSLFAENTQKNIN